MSPPNRPATAAVTSNSNVSTLKKSKKLNAPLWQSVDPKRIGGVLILTSSCEAQTEKDLGLQAKQKPIKGVNEDERLQAEDLCVPGGGAFLAQSIEKYVAQSVLGGQILADALIKAGVSATRIYFEHFASRDDHPADVLQSFFANLPESHPDAIMYYSGPTDKHGNFALGWTNEWGFNRSAIITPKDVMRIAPQSAGGGPPGNRSVILEASNTIKWLQPHPRKMGLAAWEGPAVFGGSSGPPLVRWLVGKSMLLPPGAVFCPKPRNSGSQPGSLGLVSLPCYYPLFWTLPPEPGPEHAKKAAHLLWELDTFTAPARGLADQVAACEELLCRGGSKVLCNILAAHAQESHEQEKLLLQVLRLLHRLVIHAQEERWLGSMSQVLSTALDTIALPHCPGTLYAAALSLATACASVCESARKEACESHWDEIDHVIESSLKGEHGAQAAVCAGQLVTQVVSVHPLDHGEDAEILRLLQEALVAEWEPPQLTHDVQVACLDALIFGSLHCDVVKQTILENLAHNGAMLPILEHGSADVVARMLSLLRSIAACEPRDIVADDLAEGTVEAIVDSLSIHPKHVQVQRWGLAALGAIAQASQTLCTQSVEAGAPDCVTWALGADMFMTQADVHKEAFFCAHALMLSEAGRKSFRRPSSRLSGLVAAVLVECNHSPSLSASEVPLWGVRVFERLASSPGGGASAVEPFIDPLIQVMMNAACRDATVISGAGAIGHLTTRSPMAKQRILAYRVQIQKELQRRANAAATAEKYDVEKDFQAWARVLIDGIGDHKLGGIDEDAGDPPEPWVEEEEGEEEDTFFPKT